MATEYNSREAAIRLAEGGELCAGLYCDRRTENLYNRMKRDILNIPAADVVSRDCYDRILVENDTMREMLAQIGKKPGDKMDDVRKMVTCEECDWHVDCGYHYCNKLCHPCPDNAEFFCAYGEHTNCGADMEEAKTDG